MHMNTTPIISIHHMYAIGLNETHNVQVRTITLCHIPTKRNKHRE